MLLLIRSGRRKEIKRDSQDFWFESLEGNAIDEKGAAFKLFTQIWT